MDKKTLTTITLGCVNYTKKTSQKCLIQPPNKSDTSLFEYHISLITCLLASLQNFFFHCLNRFCFRKLCWCFLWSIFFQYHQRNFFIWERNTKWLNKEILLLLLCIHLLITRQINKDQKTLLYLICWIFLLQLFVGFW